MITDLEPKFALKFFDGVIVAMRKVGRRWSEYVVDPAAVRQVLAATPVSSGLLRKNIIAVGHLDGHPFFVTLIAPRKVRVGTSGSTQRDWVFTTPPIVWGGWKNVYRVYALHRRDVRGGWPRSDTIPLYLAPFANTYRSGDICWGSGLRPGMAQIDRMDAAFITYAEGSFFIESATASPSKEFGSSIPRLYESLRGLRHYPCDDLVPQGKSLAHLLSGDAFHVTSTTA